MATCGSLSVQGGTYVQFRTVLGDIEVELFDSDKSLTVQNFLRYVRSGAYQNMFFHRCVPGFVVQGGGVATADPSDTNQFLSYIPVPSYGEISNEFNVGPQLSNVYGTIAMAKRSGDPDSATSQWFFNLGNNTTNLDTQNGGFTVFGHVVGGFTVLERFNQMNKTWPNPEHIIDLTWWFPNDPSVILFADLPVQYEGTAYPRFSDLYYVDITLLNVEVRVLSEGAREISWNSVEAKTNHVEYTTTLPPAWQQFISTNGTGARMEIRDETADGDKRFYRVRVDW